MTKNNKNLKLPKVVIKSKKRVGRGYGSGKGGHTSGRGMKGQKSRGDLNILFEGIKVKKSLLRRLPLQRGKLKLKTLQKNTTIINLEDLNKFKDGSTVNVESLIKENIISEKDSLNNFKILNNGKLTTKNLKVNVPTTKSAAVQIEKSGGTIV